MRTIRTVGILSKPSAALADKLVPEILAWLAERDIAVKLDETTAAYAGRPAEGLTGGGSIDRAGRRRHDSFGRALDARE
jgi:hypothetical protein